MGYRNKNNIASVLDEMIQSKLEEAQESGVYSSKDLADLLQMAHKMRMDEIKAQAESLMLELVGNRALYDFLVVCDETNNTPARIDRNELYIDVAIEPVKAVEFIYIPVRIKNTGDIAAGNL